MAFTRHGNPIRRRPQQGVTLFIALIVLVALTLAGLAMMRSVDTGAIVAGNIAFKEASVHGADKGIQAAHAWISANAGTAALNSDNNTIGTSSVGYFSSASLLDPDWTLDSTWTNAAVVNGGVADAAGNVVSYIIHRLCRIPNCAPNETCGGQVNVCGSTPDNAAVTGEGIDLSQPNFFTRPPATHYRVTARAVGPRNSISVVQTLMRSQ